MTVPAEHVSLTADEARALTDEVRADAHALWGKLRRLYEGKAHTALGFRSWGAYYEAEFCGSERHGKRLLAAARVLEELEPAGFRGEGTPGSPALSENAARELAPVLRNGGDAVREAWEETVKRHGQEPTAQQVREVVRGRGRSTPVEPQPSWAARLELLASELRHVARVGDCAERIEHARAALGMLGDVDADLRRLGGES